MLKKKKLFQSGRNGETHLFTGMLQQVSQPAVRDPAFHLVIGSRAEATSIHPTPFGRMKQDSRDPDPVQSSSKVRHLPLEATGSRFRAPLPAHTEHWNDSETLLMDVKWVWSGGKLRGGGGATVLSQQDVYPFALIGNDATRQRCQHGKVASVNNWCNIPQNHFSSHATACRRLREDPTARWRCDTSLRDGPQDPGWEPRGPGEHSTLTVSSINWVSSHHIDKLFR